MRLHEASRNLNIGTDTIISLLYIKGMPLKDPNINSRLSEEQCAVLYKVFGFKQPAKSIQFNKQEKPEVQAVLDEIHSKRGNKARKEIAPKTKAEKKALRQQQRQSGLKSIKGQKVSLKIKGYSKQILYTKGYGNLFVEGRVQMSDVYHKGSRLNKYWAENFLKTCNVKTEFTVIEPEVKVEWSSNAYARLRYDVTPKSSWQGLFAQLHIGKELAGKVIDVDVTHYVVKYPLTSDFFIWGYVDKDDYLSKYEVNDNIWVRLNNVGADLFAPVGFASNENLSNEAIGKDNPSRISESLVESTSLTEEQEFIEWREKQKKELDIQREKLQEVALENNQEYLPQKQVVAYECEANFFDDYELKGHTFDEFLYLDKSIPFEAFLQSTGTIVLRYKLLIALADLMSAYHNENLVLGDVNPANFEIVSDDSLVLKLKDDDMVTYKTNIIHQPEHLHFIAPEVKHHLSPITPMSECYSFASLVYQMITGNEYNITNDFSKADNIAPHIIDILFQSLSSDPMLRPKMSEWCNGLRLGLDEFAYCPNCHQWYILNQSGNCSQCKNTCKLLVNLRVGNYGEAQVYNEEHNEMEICPTVIGRLRGNVIITEYTSKVLYGYHFGMFAKKDLPVAVVTITECNSDMDITLHIIPMSGTKFTLLSDNYTPGAESFTEVTDVKINGDKLFGAMFLVESQFFNNKILKLCHI